MEQYNNLTIEQFNNRKGVTLIELVMVISIVGILATASSMYIKETIDLWRFLTFRNEVVSQGRLALFRMGRETRQMAIRTPTFEPVLVADSSRLRFTALDLNGDTYDDIVEFLRNDASELRRIFNDNPPEGDVLASNITVLKFRYYKKDNTELTSVPLSESDRKEVYRIAIELEIQSGTQTKTLKSQIYPRNLL